MLETPQTTPITYETHEVEGDPLHSRYRALVHRITATPELEIRARLMRNALERGAPDENVWWIDQLIRGALWGHSAQLDALTSLVRALMEISAQKERANYPHERDAACELLRAHFEAAHEGGREAVLFMLRDIPPHRALAGGARLPEVRLPLERDVSLGERRAMARTKDRRLLERLLLDPSELVTRNLLLNPILRVQDILVIASRRPTTPEILREVAASTRWMTYQEIREGLVINPYLDTGLALKILPTLPLPILRQIKNANDLHPTVHTFARLLVTLREERTAPLRV